MWRAYTADSIRRNKSYARSVAVAALLAALFLSLVCGVGYNLWTYDIDRISAQEGGWQGRITGALTETELAAIRAYPSVESAVKNETLSEPGQTVVDITFLSPRNIYGELPKITALLGLPEGAASYHTLLLSRYLIHDPVDKEPPLLVAFGLGVLTLAVLSVVFLLYTAFALSMGARIRQLGTLSSVGATPGQLRRGLMMEGAVLCGPPILLGALLGCGVGAGVIALVNLLGASLAGRQAAVFHVHPLVLGGTVLLSVLTVGISLWMPARKLSRLTPLSAIRFSGEGPVGKKTLRSPLLKLLFGVEGELAGNSLQARRKALRVSTVALTLSYLGFSLMLCFLALSEVSTEETYFNRYQDVWDVQTVVKDVSITAFPRTITNELKALPGAADVTVYQRGKGKALLPEADQSEALLGLGGYGALAQTGAEASPTGLFTVPVELVLLDDGAFRAYCGQAGVSPGLEGAVALNRIWDSRNSTFRNRAYVPFLKPGVTSLTLTKENGEGTVSVSLLGYAQTPPVLREGYGDDALVLVLPASLWAGLADALGPAEGNLTIRALADGANRESLAALHTLEERITLPVKRAYSFTSENRLQEKRDNDVMLRGFRVILGGFCVGLALLGVANVFSNTLGFVRRRKREFARYFSLGMTRAEMGKVFAIEGLVIGGRPLAVTLPLTALALFGMLKASHLDAELFFRIAPVVPMAVFGLAILVFVGLAYYLGGKRLLSRDLVEAMGSEDG